MPDPTAPRWRPTTFKRRAAPTVRVPLRDVVTGHYLYAFKQAKVSLGRQYSYPRTIIEPSGLVNALPRENLQTVMEFALSTYRDNPANRNGLRARYQNMMKLLSLAYLDGPKRDPAYLQAVQA